MSIKVTFDLAKRQIVVEGSEGDLIKIAQEAKMFAPSFSELRILTDHDASKNAERLHARTIDIAGSLKQFAKSLLLSTAYERIAAIAYYVNKIEDRSTFSVKEMTEWFGVCGFKKPALMPVAMSDAKRKYGLVDNKGRDKWAVTAKGEDLIARLTKESRCAA